MTKTPGTRVQLSLKLLRRTKLSRTNRADNANSLLQVSLWTRPNQVSTVPTAELRIRDGVITRFSRRTLFILGSPCPNVHCAFRSDSFILVCSYWSVGKNLNNNNRVDDNGATRSGGMMRLNKLSRGTQLYDAVRPKLRLCSSRRVLLSSRESFTKSAKQEGMSVGH